MMESNVPNPDIKNMDSILTLMESLSMHPTLRMHRDIQAQHQKINVDLVVKAVKVMGISRKEVSVIAIQKYIQHKTSLNVFSGRAKFLLRKALLKSLETGILIRPKHYIKTGGVLTGSYLLAKKTGVCKISKKKLGTKNKHIETYTKTSKNGVQNNKKKVTLKNDLQKKNLRMKNLKQKIASKKANLTIDNNKP